MRILFYVREQKGLHMHMLNFKFKEADEALYIRRNHYMQRSHYTTMFYETTTLATNRIYLCIQI